MSILWPWHHDALIEKQIFDNHLLAEREWLSIYVHYYRKWLLHTLRCLLLPEPKLEQEVNAGLLRYLHNLDKRVQINNISTAATMQQIDILDIHTLRAFTKSLCKGKKAYYLKACKLSLPLRTLPCPGYDIVTGRLRGTNFTVGPHLGVRSY